MWASRNGNCTHFYVNFDAKQSKNASFHLKSKDEIKDITSFVSIGDNKYFYNDLYIYLKTLEKATFKDKLGNTYIKWNLVKYPDSLINGDVNRNTGNKKKYNYRQKAKNYIIENNKLYFTGHANKNNVKLIIQFNKDKINILNRAHNNNGHLGINRTYNKIKEYGILLGYYD